MPLAISNSAPCCAPKKAAGVAQLEAVPRGPLILPPRGRRGRRVARRQGRPRGAFGWAEQKRREGNLTAKAGRKRGGRATRMCWSSTAHYCYSSRRLSRCFELRFWFSPLCLLGAPPSFFFARFVITTAPLCFVLFSADGGPRRVAARALGWAAAGRARRSVGRGRVSRPRPDHRLSRRRRLGAAPGPRPRRKGFQKAIAKTN